jgi:hypothetical protein
VIGLVTHLLPVALAVYFLYRAVKRPIFLLGIPFLQVMGQAVFFWGLRPFRMPVALGTNGVVLMWMVLALVWCMLRSSSRGAVRSPTVRRFSRPLPAEYLLVALAILVLVKLYWGSIVSTNTDALLGQFAPWGLLLAGYVVVREIVQRSSSEDVAAFLLAIAVVTGIASILFILHQGLGIAIYSADAYQTITFQGQRLTRTYWIMSPFLLVSLASGVDLTLGGAKGWFRAIGIGLVIISLVAVFLSYTRNYVLAAVAVIVTLTVVRWLKERDVDVLARRSATVALILICAGVLFASAMPGPAGYLLHRLTSLKQPTAVSSDQNLLVRQTDLQVVGSETYRSHALIGAPLGNEDALSERVARWIPDSTWVGVVYWTGFVGLVIVVGLFVLFGIGAFRLFMRESSALDLVGGTLLGGVVALLVNSLTGWSFLDRSVYAMGFWLFAFVAGETVKLRDRSRAPAVEEVPNDSAPTSPPSVAGSPATSAR